MEQKEQIDELKVQLNKVVPEKVGSFAEIFFKYFASTPYVQRVQVPNVQKGLLLHLKGLNLCQLWVHLHFKHNQLPQVP